MTQQTDDAPELTWTAEPTPTWDTDKAAAFSPAGPTVHGLGTPAEGDALGDAWWRAETGDGEVAAFGRLDDTWGDAEVLVAVVPAFRGRGVGAWAMDRLAEEAAARSLNYVYNVVPVGHPDREAVAAWLAGQGFDARDTGELRRRVTTRAATTAPSQ
ncbi:GNAT family N-acetyltransferase [Actinomycetospora sp. TBRC 11914]|uniref:GNAT family N-acetyltransferase n=1 Tax=Actinomycetospora sp. TBRC 11914 TaxID=2729387 RepID=UPI00145ED735|nr:GNAT family N-acetyltransferase [Actinomycetospora sp. TBRC 11914]NMO92919.1 GNAT family N-acetyltransferase [Actinomycetospora sp. TBRC 11914]